MNKKHHRVGMSCPVHGHQWVTIGTQTGDGPVEITDRDPENLKCSHCDTKLVVKTIDAMDSADGLIDLADDAIEDANLHGIKARELYDSIMRQVGVHHLDRTGIARGIAKWALTL